MYVRALYLRASGGKIPELKRVIVVYQNQIVMTESLEAAIDKIFPRSGARPVDMTSAAPSGTSPGASSGAASGNAAGGAGGATPVEASTAASAGSATSPGDLATLAARAQTHYDQAIKAQRDGDWARYGEELKKLGAILDQMRKTR
jgi:uncharacterized protein